MAVVPTFDACMVHFDGLQFSFYTPDQIRKLSVKHIVCPVCFDETGTAVENGLHDPALGPTAPLVGCVTCGLDESGCPGHFGHIELPLPAYNPFFFDYMLKILRSVCLNCFNFRLSKFQVDRYFTVFTFLRCGKLFKALDVQLHTGKIKESSENFKLAQEKLVKEAEAIRQQMDLRTLKTHQITKNEHVLYQQCMVQFLETLIKPKVCTHCGCRSPALKKEGRSKIFVQPLTSKEMTLNINNGTIPCSLLSGMPMGQKQTQEYITQIEVMKILEKLWIRQHPLMDLIGGGTGLGIEGYKAYFFEVLPVLPNRYRPTSLTMGRIRSLHNQTALLIRLINTILEIKSIGVAEEEGNSKKKEAALIEQTVQKWNELQNYVDQTVDGGNLRAGDKSVIGVKQFLEKKTGLFRKHMMGKRVNFVARSTISPDINLGVGEVGVPPEFAKKLSFPEKVTQWNYNELRKLIERGPHELPGAVAVENDKGVIMDLAYLTEPRRKALARRLYVHKDPRFQSQDDFAFRNQPIGGVKTVYRHLRNGDLLLTNRQPTLHKGSLMAHKARILPGEKTIRLHYANCASFNADFDGDEMNLHFPQDHMSRAEGYGILHAHHQYLNPSNGSPMRGLIQDNIAAGTIMTSKDTFLEKVDYTQLLVTALSRRFDTLAGSQEPYLTTRVCRVEDEIILEMPTVLKPATLWTGKQVISSVIGSFAKDMLPLTTSYKCKTPADIWGDQIESHVVFRDGCFLTGVMDKSSYGQFGLIHACQELYGNEFAGQLLSSFSKMFVYYFQTTGFTCAFGHAILKKSIERKRIKHLKRAELIAIEATAKMLDMELDPRAEKDPKCFLQEKERVTNALARRYRQDPETGKVHDTVVKGRLHELSSDIVKTCLPDGIAQPFRSNGLAIMTSTGAKGSFVNYSQISCLLGQQELEGRRVPRTATGRTLPCFPPYDPGARAGGFIGDRFLTGLRPPEYYFHCMAGREGLVDTSVKTANSGYLQRCLVKCLESLRVMYDGTVRDDTDGSLCQFYYGEDGLDVTGNSYLNNFKFISENAGMYKKKLKIKTALRSSTLANLSELEYAIKKYLRKRNKLIAGGASEEEVNAIEPIMSLYKPTMFGCMSEAVSDNLLNYTMQNPDWLLHNADERKLAPRDLEQIVKMKYMGSLVSPGEAVGILAAQSVGEPSTQMTLNTFHMAGRGEANVTLGIPRLREILMTATQSIKTPVMILPLNQGLGQSHAKALAARLRKITLASCVKGLYVEEQPVAKMEHLRNHYNQLYRIGMEFYSMESYPEEYDLNWSQIEDTFVNVFCPIILIEVKKELKRYANDEVILMAKSTQSTAQQDEEEGEEKPSKKKQYEDDEMDESNEEGKRQYHGGRSEQAYDDPDVEDAAFIKASMETLEIGDESDTDEDNNSTKKPTKRKQSEPDEEPVNKVKNTSSTSSNAVINEDALKCELVLTFPLNSAKLPMLNIAEQCAAYSAIRKKDGIEKCYISDAQSGVDYAVQTDGINFAAAWESSDLIDVDNIQCNDVHAVLRTYGVEAARTVIVKECKGVFGAYGIEVNPRHLGLIADHMTNQGIYKGCNFSGIKTQSSPILKMSFERCTHFIREATLAGEYDPIRSPSSRIAVGRPPLVGTGCMDVISYPPEQS